MSHPARDAWILAARGNFSFILTGVASCKGCVDFSDLFYKREWKNNVASRKGCVDFSIVRCVNGVWVIGRIPQGMRGFQQFYLQQKRICRRVASRKGCVDFSERPIDHELFDLVSHPARDAWILATKTRWIENKWHVAFFIKCADACHRILYRMRGFQYSWLPFISKHPRQQKTSAALTIFSPRSPPHCHLTSSLYK